DPTGWPKSNQDCTIGAGGTVTPAVLLDPLTGGGPPCAPCFAPVLASDPKRNHAPSPPRRLRHRLPRWLRQPRPRGAGLFLPRRRAARSARAEPHDRGPLLQARRIAGHAREGPEAPPVLRRGPLRGDRRPAFRRGLGGRDPRRPGAGARGDEA